MTPDRQFKHVGMSPFLGELSGGLFQRMDGSSDDYQPSIYREKSAAGHKSLRRKPKKLNMSDFSQGCKVSHPFFGLGTVTKLSGGRSLDVHFDRHGLKTLHLDYAKLKKL